MDKTPWYKNPEMLVALSALLIGLVTAVISIYSAYIDRAYAKASVWPRLEIFGNASIDGDSGEHVFYFEVFNNGTGPAIIQTAKVTLDSKPLSEWSDLKIPVSYQSHISSRIIAPQKSVIPVKFGEEVFEAAYSMNQNLTVELCYCSIYEDCWSTDRRNKPKPVELCATESTGLFKQ